MRTSLLEERAWSSGIQCSALKTGANCLILLVERSASVALGEISRLSAGPRESPPIGTDSSNLHYRSVSLKAADRGGQGLADARRGCRHDRDTAMACSRRLEE